MSLVRTTRPVPPDRASAYRAEGWWDSRGLGDGIEQAAAATPDDRALADDRTQLSWTDLATAIADGVGTLGAAGVGPGDPLLVICGNTVEGAIAVHAALRRGATTALLDRRVGSADVAAARRVLGGRVRIVVAAADASGFGLDPAEVIESERFAPDRRDAGPTPWDEPDRDAPAVVLFTSGTTGRPKAVVHSLNTLTAGAANMATITGCDTGDVIFLVSPLAGITGLMQLLLAADQHAALVLTDTFDPDLTLSRMNQVGATILGGAPVIAERILDAAQRGPRQVTLKTLALGGAMIPRPMLEVATGRFGIEVARVYGSSEAPNFSGSTPTDEPERRLGDDGAVTAGGEILVGSAGHPDEGLVRGPGVFLGYADPADNEHCYEDGWFRTGDLVEMHEGRLTVTGRLKEIVNRNGLKISPSEIDHALTSMPGIAEHACFAAADADTGERLAVAVRPAEGTPVDLHTVIDHLLAAGVARRKLPEQLVVWVGPLPRTASGKIVRSQLVRDAPSMTNEFAERLQSPSEHERASS